MSVGGNLRYPSLQSIADLFRSSINDDMAGATDTPGEGLIATNTAPFMLTFMNASIRDVFSDLRNVGDPALVLDNYLLLGIPALAVANQTTQVSLSYAGYFDGQQMHAQWKLPIGLEKLSRVWERPNASAANFTPMAPAPYGLPGVLQGDCMGQWEMRQNALWMPGAMVSVDLRLRGTLTYPDLLGSSIDFTTAYVPIVDCQNAVVAKMLVLYARRFAPEQCSVAVQEEAKYMGKLTLEVVRQQQGAENSRADFGLDAVADFAWNNGL